MATRIATLSQVEALAVGGTFRAAWSRSARHALLVAALGSAWACNVSACSSTKNEEPKDAGSRHSDAATSSSSSSSSDAATSSSDDRFSFFVTSYRAMQQLSGTEDGFGGDLRCGETGPGAGLRGADKICSEIAEGSMPGSSAKKWRAFLSVSAGEDGAQVDAIDRIGEGPWYDRVGRVLALTKSDLLNARPAGADEVISHDFPNEDGIPNQKPDPGEPSVDNHDILTGTSAEGRLYDATATCKDWTSARGEPTTEGRPRVGHSWDRMGTDLAIQFAGGMGGPDGGFPGFGERPDGGPMMRGPGNGGRPPEPQGQQGPPGDGGLPFGMGFGQSWMSTLDEAGCAPGVNLIQNGGPRKDVPTVGSGGGYGGIYCFALKP